MAEAAYDSLFLVCFTYICETIFGEEWAWCSFTMTLVQFYHYLSMVGWNILSQEEFLVWIAFFVVDLVI